MGRYALLVATGRYDDPELSRLRSPAQDVRELKAVLEHPEVGGFDQVTVLEDACRQDVADAVEAVLADRQPGDLVLLHFSCHGVQDPWGRLHLATTDTRRGRLTASSLAADDLNRLLEHSRAHAKVLLLDCCYSGSFAAGLRPRAGGTDVLSGQFAARGYVVLTASSALEYAFEGEVLSLDSPRPSVFSGAVVSALTSPETDRDGDGWISVSDLHAHVYSTVRARTQQTPTYFAHGVQGEIRLARAPRSDLDWNDVPGKRARERPWVPAVESAALGVAALTATSAATAPLLASSKGYGGYFIPLGSPPALWWYLVPMLLASLSVAWWAGRVARRRAFLAASACFVAAGLIAGLIPGTAVLPTARAVQGTAGGVMAAFSVAGAIALAQTGERRYTLPWVAVLGPVGALAPMTPGVEAWPNLLDGRWPYLLTALLGTLPLAGSWFLGFLSSAPAPAAARSAVRTPHPHSAAVGAVFFGAAFTGVAMASRTVKLGSIFALVPCTVLLVVALAVVLTLRGRQSFISIRSAGGLLVAMAATATASGAAALESWFGSYIRGTTAGSIGPQYTLDPAHGHGGTVFAAALTGLAVAPVLARGLLARLSHTAVVLGGFAVCCAGLLLLATAAASVTVADLGWRAALSSFGFGLLFVALLRSLAGSTTAEGTGVAGALVSFLWTLCVITSAWTDNANIWEDKKLTDGPKPSDASAAPWVATLLGDGFHILLITVAIGVVLALQISLRARSRE
ncbi:caspase, EACC1-associated type [Streptomyces mirabilis]|uniref:caspase, EACC1-associated type n=1 Tax=Streptomyces mirabilis TaxID=68239 RepID=UPI003690FA46